MHEITKVESLICQEFENHWQHSTSWSPHNFVHQWLFHANNSLQLEINTVVKKELVHSFTWFGYYKVMKINLEKEQKKSIINFRVNINLLKLSL